MIITHGNLSYRPNHTAWVEIEAFSRCIQSHLQLECQVLPIEQLQFNTPLEDDIVIFCSGVCRADLIEWVNHSSANVHVVIQDPNYDVTFRINRTFTLLTPFERFDRFSEVCSKMNMSEFEHHFIPFGVMSLIDPDYDQLYKESTIDSVYPKYSTVYVGSLKPDRVYDMSILSTIGCDFYGNFKKTDVENLVGHPAKCVCYGRTESPFVVPSLYKYYKSAALAVDPKMYELRVSHIRFVEYARAQVVVRVVSPLTDDYREWLLRYSKQLTPCTFLFSLDTFKEDVAAFDTVIKEAFHHVNTNKQRVEQSTE